MRQCIVAGVDAGSSAVKIALFDGERFTYHLRPSGWNPKEEATTLLQEAVREWEINISALQQIVGTGYGRCNLPFVTNATTEITCHAKGAAYLCPGAGTVIDIGGQDSKAIRVDARGRVEDFVMNDKCAAGTGRFLQVMTSALGMDIAELAKIPLAENQPCQINAMCTVFAESEVIGLLHQGYSRDSIMAGIIKSITGRVTAMASRIRPKDRVVLTGGVSRVTAVTASLEQDLGMAVVVPERAIFAGAIGAALLAFEAIEKQR